MEPSKLPITKLDKTNRATAVKFLEKILFTGVSVDEVNIHPRLPDPSIGITMLGSGVLVSFRGETRFIPMSQVKWIAIEELKETGA